MNTNDNNTLLADTAVVAAPALLQHRSTIKRRSFGRSVVRLLKQQRIAPPASDAADGGRVKAYKKKDVPADRDTEAGDATTTTTSRIRTTMAERARALNGRARGRSECGRCYS